MTFEEYYLNPNVTPYSYQWLLYTEYDPHSTTFPQLLNIIRTDYAVKIVQDGQFKNKLIAFHYVDPIDTYVIPGQNPFTQNWLSLTQGGSALTPEHSVIYKVVSDGDYKGKTYLWNIVTNKYEAYSITGVFYDMPADTPPNTSKTETVTEDVDQYMDLNTGMDVYIVEGSTPQSSGWLSISEGGTALTPMEGVLYVIQTEGQYKNSKWLWNTTNTVYEEYVDNGIYYINKTAEVQRILTLDMTASYNGVPPRSMMLEDVQKYIEDNKIGDITENVTVSFVRLSSTTEYANIAPLEIVELGDTVKVEFEALGVNKDLTVINTIYDVIKDKYEEIELGERSKDLSDTAITNNDNISSLTNDAHYCDQTTVNTLIAETVNAKFIEAVSAEFSYTQIKELTSEKINAQIIEAASFNIDQIVSRLLTVENANISDTLKAGTVTVSGTIYALAGEIGGVYIHDGLLECDDVVYKAMTETLTASPKGRKAVNTYVADEMLDDTIDPTTGDYVSDIYKTLVDGNLVVRGTIYADAGVINGDLLASGTIRTSEICISSSYDEIVTWNDPDHYNIQIAYATGSPGSASWLSDENGNVIDPRDDLTIIYRIIDNPTYGNMLLYWNTGAYALYSPENYMLDSNGNVITPVNGRKYIVTADQGSIKNVIFKYQTNKMVVVDSTNTRKFYVDSTGHLEASEAVIYGTIYATEGSFSGLLDVGSGAFTVDSEGTANISTATVENLTAKFLSVDYGFLKPIKIGYSVQVGAGYMTKYISLTPKQNSSTTVDYEFEGNIVRYMTSNNSITLFVSATSKCNNVATAVPIATNVDMTVTINMTDVDGNPAVVTKVIKFEFTPSAATISKNVTFVNEVAPGGTITSASQIMSPLGATYGTSGQVDLEISEGIVVNGNGEFDGDVTADSFIPASDRNLKKNISYDLSKYAGIIDELKPAYYSFKSDEVNAIHLGFIAQDVEEIQNGMNIPKDEQILYATIRRKDGEFYGLNYTDLHALEVYEIQKLKQEIADLKAEIQKLKGGS